MKLIHTFLAIVIGCFAFSFVSCSKVSNAIPPSPSATGFLKGADGPPLWFVDNVEVINPTEKGSIKVGPNDIQSINIISPGSGLLKDYGPKAVNGVVLIVTKKEASSARGFQVRTPN